MYQNFRSIQENIMLIEGALHGDFVIPEFGQFTKHLEEIYQHCKENAEGKVGMNDPDLVKVKINVYFPLSHKQQADVHMSTLQCEKWKTSLKERDNNYKTGQSFNFIIDNNKKLRMTEERKTSTLACFTTYEQDMYCLATVQAGI